MKCPKCGGRYVQIHGTFAGCQYIRFAATDEDSEVVDSEPTDFSWEDHDEVVCLDCGHTGTAAEFEAAKANA